MTSDGVELRPIAIVTGMLVDFLGSTIAAAVLFAALGGTDPASGELMNSPTWLALSLALSFLLDGIGGYVTARLAPGAEMNNAFVMGVAMSVLALVFTALSEPRPPLVYSLIGVLATTPAALAGGWVRARTSRRDAK